MGDDIMKYRYLNEVLLNWNSEDKIQDNNIIKSSDIKDKIDQYFIHIIFPYDEKKSLRIFNNEWPLFRFYRDKVYINNKQVPLNDEGWVQDPDTGHVIEFKPGEHRIYIKDIDQVINCNKMFYHCMKLWKVPLFDTSKVKDMSHMFECTRIETVPEFNTVNVQNMNYMFYVCPHLRSVPKFNLKNLIWNHNMFSAISGLDNETKKNWGFTFGI